MPACKLLQNDSRISVTACNYHPEASPLLQQLREGCNFLFIVSQGEVGFGTSAFLYDESSVILPSGFFLGVMIAKGHL